MALSAESTVKLATGYMMPLVGFGVYRNYDTKPSVLEALKSGYRHIDTAQAYRNEAHVGDAVKESSLKRGDIFITTKVISSHHGYEKTRKVIQQSLEKIGGDYIDLFLIHDPLSGAERRLQAYRALLDAQKEGLIRTVGVSNYGVKHLEEIRTAGLEAPAVNQIELHPLCQQKPIVKYCQEHNILVEAYSPLLQGKLDFPVFHEIAKKHNKDVGQILIRWSLQKGYVPLPKSSNPARIVSNFQVFDFELDDGDMAKLDALDKGKEGAVTWNCVDAE